MEQETIDDYHYDTVGCWGRRVVHYDETGDHFNGTVEHCTYK